MIPKTADLCDQYQDQLQVLTDPLNAYGKVTHFGGPIVTLKVFEDNILVKQTLEEAGDGRVLVIDGGGSRRCALIGDNLAHIAMKHQWGGIIVYGCIRDAVELQKMNIGIYALGTCPIRSIKRGEGQQDIAVRFGGVTFVPGWYVFADEDGIVVSQEALRA